MKKTLNIASVLKGLHAQLDIITLERNTLDAKVGQLRFVLLPENQTHISASCQLGTQTQHSAILCLKKPTQGGGGRSIIISKIL